MSKEKGYEYSSFNPGWIKKEKGNVDDDFKRIFMFYVINTPCTDLSSSGIDITKYGWPKDVWKNNNKKKLKERLFDVAGLERNTNFFVVKTLTEVKSMFEKAKMKKEFPQKRDENRIAIYKGRYSEFLSICYHIRNSLAHGRFTIYTNNSQDQYYAFEDGVKTNGEFSIRSRMIIKKSTLLKWIDIIENREKSLTN